MSKFKDVIRAAQDQPQQDAPPPAPKPKRQTGKRSDGAYTQVSAYVRTHIHKAVKRELVDADLDFSDLVDLLLFEWLQSRKNSGD